MMLIDSKSGKKKYGSKTQILEKISRDCLVLGIGNALFFLFQLVFIF